MANYNTLTTKEQFIEKGWFPQFGSSWWNLLDKCGVEIRDYFQRVLAQNNNPRQGTIAASIAYDDGTGQQRLLRWIRYNQREDELYAWYLSDLYVSSPDSVTMIYPEYAYSTRAPIYLDDLTNQLYVNLYAEDTYARQPLVKNDKLSNTADTSPRKPRTTTDARANDVRNYFYNRAAWESRTFACDMWNAPILMFRITRVYDRGADNHSATTVDGLRLTKIAQHQWEDADGTEADGNLDMFRTLTMNVIWSNCYKRGVSTGEWHINGKQIDFPTWRTAW